MKKYALMDQGDTALTECSDGDYYLASEVDEFMTVAGLTNWTTQAERIAELEKALRTVSIIDLGFGVPKYFCAACVSYGDGPESIRHKSDCVTAQALLLMGR